MVYDKDAIKEKYKEFFNPKIDASIESYDSEVEQEFIKDLK